MKNRVHAFRVGQQASYCLAAARRRRGCKASACAASVAAAAAKLALSADPSDRLLGLLGEAGEAMEHGEQRCRPCRPSASASLSAGSCCQAQARCPAAPAAAAPGACRTATATAAGARPCTSAAAAAAACASAAACRRCRCACWRWYCCTAATRSKNPNSGHSTWVKTSSACRHCHSKKSDSRVSPLVRTSKSTGGQPRVYSAPSSAAAVSRPGPLPLLDAPLLLLSAACWAAKLSSARCSSSDALRGGIEHAHTAWWSGSRHAHQLLP